MLSPIRGAGSGIIQNTSRNDNLEFGMTPET